MSEAFDYEAMRAIFVAASGLPTTNVVWSREGQPIVGQMQAVIGQALPTLIGLLTLKVTSDVILGKDDYVEAYDGNAASVKTDQVSRHVLTITGRITEFGQRQALNTLGTVRRKFSGVKIPGMLQALNMSLNDTLQLLYSDEAIDNKSHSAAVFELKLNWMTNVDITDEFGLPDGTNNWIQTVDVAGDVIDAGYIPIPTGGSSMIIVGIADTNLFAGDVVTTANNANVDRVTPANTANLAAGDGEVYGIVLIPALQNFPVTYANVNSVLTATQMGLTTTEQTYVVLNKATGRGIVKNIPEAGDIVLGRIGVNGRVHFMPYTWKQTETLFGVGRYAAANDYSVDVSDMLRKAVAESYLNDLQTNAGFRPVHIPKGVWRLDKPVHVSKPGSTIYGAAESATHIRSLSHAGPAFYVAPDVGTFPLQLNSFGALSAAIFRSETLQTGDHWLSLRQYGAGCELNGLSAVTVETVVKIDPSAYTSTSFIFNSFGDRFSDDPYAEAVGLSYGGPGSPTTTNSLYWTITTTVRTQTVCTPTNSLLQDGLHHKVAAVWDGTIMKVYIDGVLQTLLPVNGGTATIGGTLVQRSWEQAVLGGGGRTIYGGGRLYYNTNCFMASFRLSNIARTGGTVGLPTTKFTEDANTLQLMNFDTTDIDGIFVKGRCRGTAGNTNVVNLFVPHRQDNVGLFAIGFCRLHDLTFTTLYGPAIDCNGAAGTHIDRIIGTVKTGVVIDQNCYKSTVSDVDFSGSAASSRFGVSCVASSQVVTLRNIAVSGFEVGVLIGSASDLVLEGTIHTTSCKVHVLANVVGTMVGTGDLEMSDEGSTIGGRIPEYFLALRLVDNATFTSPYLSQAESSCPLLFIDGDGDIPTKLVFQSPIMYGNANPGIVKITAAPTGDLEFNMSSMDPTIPFFVPGSSMRVWMNPERETNSLVVNVAGLTTTTIGVNSYIGNRTYKFSGALAADCTATFPLLNIGEKWVQNNTTGGHNIICKLAGSAVTITVPPGGRMVFGVDGVDISQAS